MASFLKVTVRGSSAQRKYLLCLVHESEISSLHAVQVEGFMVEEHMHNVLSDKERRICKVVEG